ncbi:MAG: Maf family nucleotide pyrophosphatase [Gammaproteobacteria bacterium]|nr:Maf family nucleotide pyrophosphatase [Gammaproteobacteria bacterium]
MTRLILASTSPYRAELLQRLQISFETVAPHTDETPLPSESPANLVTRLAELKARSVLDSGNSAHPGAALVIGSDQVADLNGDILGKPHTAEIACQQLAQVSGRTVQFRTGLCLLDLASGQSQLDRIDTEVRFRTLTEAEILRYVELDQPLDCAGSFRSEGLGISLLEGMSTSDPTALIGLPLVRLGQMLREAGVWVP